MDTKYYQIKHLNFLNNMETIYRKYTPEEVKIAEQETNEYYKSLREKNGRTYPTYQVQDSNHLNNPDIGYQY